MEYTGKIGSLKHLINIMSYDTKGPDINANAAKMTPARARRLQQNQTTQKQPVSSTLTGINKKNFYINIIVIGFLLILMLLLSEEQIGTIIYFCMQALQYLHS